MARATFPLTLLVLSLAAVLLPSFCPPVSVAAQSTSIGSGAYRYDDPPGATASGTSAPLYSNAACNTMSSGHNLCSLCSWMTACVLLWNSLS